jgi:MinD superfamily P-loop ATPase
MKIAVLSGKGGTGKTFVSVNLSVTAPQALYVDCDVEEPNGHLFLKPEAVSTSKVVKRLPVFDVEKCTGCRACLDFCRFNALAYIKDKPMVFKDVCHSCGGCELICKHGAVSEEAVEIGHIDVGMHNHVEVASGFLNIGEASGIAIIQGLLRHADAYKGDNIVIDCPPGSACSVVESIQDADYCILVAEPTVFGAHNFEMVHELVTIMNKPCGVVINKAEEGNTLMDDICAEKGLKVIAKIPYRKETARAGANGQIAVEIDAHLREVFADLWRVITEEVKV